MKQLSPTWFVDGLPDFEYKKYVLLAFLQEVSKKFNKTKLYPALSDLVFQYNNLKNFLEDKNSLYDNFPKEVSGFDLDKFKVEYRKIIEDDDLMNEIEDIVSYSIPKVKESIDEGKEIYEFIEKHIHISPVGLIPLNINEGYLLLRNGNEKKTRVYEYKESLFESAGEKYRSIRTQFITSYERNYVNTMEYIKSDLISRIKKLPNPAAYAIEAGHQFPVEETLLPVVKRMVVKYLIMR